MNEQQHLNDTIPETDLSGGEMPPNRGGSSRNTRISSASSMLCSQPILMEGGPRRRTSSKSEFRSKTFHGERRSSAHTIVHRSSLIARGSILPKFTSRSVRTIAPIESSLGSEGIMRFLIGLRSSRVIQSHTRAQRNKKGKGYHKAGHTGMF